MSSSAHFCPGHGNTFPVGCVWSESVVFHEFFADNSDADKPALQTLLGIYDEGCGLDKVHREIEARVRTARPGNQFDLVRIAVEERGRAASPQWQADCVSRRVGILNGVPETVDGHQRANLSFFLLRDVRIRGVRDLTTADIVPQLAQVAEALASGDTLLA